MISENSSRRSFIRNTALALGGTIYSSSLAGAPDDFSFANDIGVFAHVWVYASKFPPKWDCTPILENVFSDLSAAGIEGVELMESTLRHDDAVKRIAGYVDKYNLPVAGSSYGIGFNFWDAEQHKKIWDDVSVIVPKLSALNAKVFGLSVGDAKRMKTPAELDAQAAILKRILALCDDHGIVPNLHNHIYEVANELHDLRGTLERVPELKLGPDLNWLIRAGIDPVWFINTYGKQMVYLHLRDQYGDGRWTEYLGQGTTNFPAIAKALKAQNFSGNAAIELAFPSKFEPTQSLEKSWTESRKYVNKVFKW